MQLPHQHKLYLRVTCTATMRRNQQTFVTLSSKHALSKNRLVLSYIQTFLWLAALRKRFQGLLSTQIMCLGQTTSVLFMELSSIQECPYRGVPVNTACVLHWNPSIRTLLNRGHLHKQDTCCLAQTHYLCT